MLKYTNAELEYKKRMARTVIDLDGSDLAARQTLLRVNKEISRRERENQRLMRPIMPRL